MPIYRIPLGFVFISEEQICSNHLGKKTCKVLNKAYTAGTTPYLNLSDNIIISCVA